MTVDLGVLVGLALWGVLLGYAGPYGRMRSGGIRWGLSNREGPPGPSPPWVGRGDRAFENHKENLLLFVCVVAAVHLAGRADDVTAAAAVAFGVSRVGHGLVYLAGLTVLRTALYYVSIAAVLVMVSRLF